jgi:hypothetical protein
LLARRALGLDVEDLDIDVTELAPDRVGTFDVVLLLGVLYHLKDPITAIERAEAVKPGETPGGHLVCMSASGVGWLIQATVGSLGGIGGRANRCGLAA